MIFENPQLEISELPAFQESGYIGLHPAYLKVMRYGTLFFLVLLLAAPIGLLFITDGWFTLHWWLIGFGAWVLIAAISLLITGPAFRQKGYAFRERDISFKTGLINRSTTTIPFNRVQHCDIKQGIISRYFGLSKLNVYTAGGAKSDLSIPGLTPEIAHKLMEFVLQKTLAFDEEE